MGGSPILAVVDFLDDIFSGKPSAQGNVVVLMSYVGFLFGFGTIWHHCSDQDFSFILTLAGAVQTFGFFLLLHKVRVAKSVAGISSKTVQIYVLVFCFRLSSTMVKNGYLPVDSTGDWVYQATDIASLIFAFQVLYSMHKKYKNTYQEDLDTMPIWNIVGPAVVFACCFHGKLNHSLLFDKAWSIALWLDTVAMLPQLWMLVAKGGEVEALTANYVAMIFVSRALSFSFWLTGYPELGPKDGGFNTVGFLIMAAHSLQLLFSADFMYHYFVWTRGNCGIGCNKKGGGKGMILPSGSMEC